MTALITKSGQSQLYKSKQVFIDNNHPILVVFGQYNERLWTMTQKLTKIWIFDNTNDHYDHFMTNIVKSSLFIYNPQDNIFFSV